MAIGIAGMGGGQRYSYSLWLKPNVLNETNPGIEITNVAQQWKRSVRLQGGFWTGSFTIPSGPQAWEAWQNWLGRHVQEVSGGMVTWAGMVYELEISRNGIVRRKSFDEMANRVRSNFLNLKEDADYTSWVENTVSQDKFGIKEEILELGSELDDVAATQADRYLSEHDFPSGRAVAFSDDEKLTVSVCGYSFTANWKYTTCDSEISAGNGILSDATGEYMFTLPDPGGYDLTPHMASAAPAIASYYEYTVDSSGNPNDGPRWGYIGEQRGANNQQAYLYQDQQLTTRGTNNTHADEVFVSAMIRTDVSQWARDMFTAGDIDFLNAGVIEECETQADRLGANIDENPKRCWDALYEIIAKKGDSDGDPWRIWVGPALKLHIQAVPTTPRYYFIDGEWCENVNGAPVNPWQMQPGVCRDMNNVYEPLRSGSWLEDPRDFLVDEIEVNWEGQISPSITDIDRTEFLLYNLKMTDPEIARRSPHPLKSGYWYYRPGTSPDDPGEFKWTDVPYQSPSEWTFVGVGVEPQSD